MALRLVQLPTSQCVICGWLTVRRAFAAWIRTWTASAHMPSTLRLVLFPPPRLPEAQWRLIPDTVCFISWITVLLQEAFSGSAILRVETAATALLISAAHFRWGAIPRPTRFPARRAVHFQGTIPSCQTQPRSIPPAIFG